MPLLKLTLHEFLSVDRKYLIEQCHHDREGLLELKKFDSRLQAELDDAITNYYRDMLQRFPNISNSSGHHRSVPENSTSLPNVCSEDDDTNDQIEDDSIEKSNGNCKNGMENPENTASSHQVKAYASKFSSGRDREIQSSMPTVDDVDDSRSEHTPLCHLQPRNFASCTSDDSLASPKQQPNIQMSSSSLSRIVTPPSRPKRKVQLDGGNNKEMDIPFNPPFKKIKLIPRRTHQDESEHLKLSFSDDECDDFFSEMGDENSETTFDDESEESEDEELDHELLGNKKLAPRKFPKSNGQNIVMNSSSKNKDDVGYDSKNGDGGGHNLSSNRKKSSKLTSLSETHPGPFVTSAASSAGVASNSQRDSFKSGNVATVARPQSPPSHLLNLRNDIQRSPRKEYNQVEDCEDENIVEEGISNAQSKEVSLTEPEEQDSGQRRYPRELAPGVTGKLDDTCKLRRSVGRTREQLNQYLQPLGLCAKFAITAVCSKDSKVSHLVLNEKWNEIQHDSNETLEFWVGLGEGRWRSATLLDPSQRSDCNQNWQGIPIFWAGKQQPGGALCYYIGHYKCVCFRKIEGKNIVFRGKPRQCFIEMEFIDFNEGFNNIIDQMVVA